MFKQQAHSFQLFFSKMKRQGQVNVIFEEGLNWAEDKIAIINRCSELALNYNYELYSKEKKILIEFNFQNFFYRNKKIHYQKNKKSQAPFDLDRHYDPSIPLIASMLIKTDFGCQIKNNNFEFRRNLYYFKNWYYGQDYLEDLKKFVFNNETFTVNLTEHIKEEKILKEIENSLET